MPTERHSTQPTIPSRTRPVAAGSVARAAAILKLAWLALATGSRMIPLGDNGMLIRELAARVSASGS